MPADAESVRSAQAPAPVAIDITAAPQPAPVEVEPPRLAWTYDRDVTMMRFPRGRIDGHAVREMYEQSIEVLQTHDVRLLIDLTGVDMVSSGAMGMLVTIKKRCLAVGAQFHIAAPDPLIMQSFKIMRLDVVLSLFDSVDAARRAFKP